jgi:hypothetical protein
MNESLNKSLKPEIFSIHLVKDLAKGNRILQSAVDVKLGVPAHLYEEPLEGMETIDLLEKTADGKIHELGFCTFKIYEKPIPFFYVSWVVRENKPLTEEVIPKDKTVGDEIMQKVNTMIEEKKLPGILGNTVPKDVSASNIYERNGWKKLPFVDENSNTVWMGYNLPENLTADQITEIVKETKADDPYFASHGG